MNTLFTAMVVLGLFGLFGRTDPTSPEPDPEKWKQYEYSFEGSAIEFRLPEDPKAHVEPHVRMEKGRAFLVIQRHDYNPPGRNEFAGLEIGVAIGELPAGDVPSWESLLARAREADEVSELLINGRSWIQMRWLAENHPGPHGRGVYHEAYSTVIDDNFALTVSGQYAEQIRARRSQHELRREILRKVIETVEIRSATDGTNGREIEVQQIDGGKAEKPPGSERTQ